MNLTHPMSLVTTSTESMKPIPTSWAPMKSWASTKPTRMPAAAIAAEAAARAVVATPP
jgi:hypothetical protein